MVIVKKGFALFLACAMLFMSSLSAWASPMYKANIVQESICLPKVKAYVNLSDANDVVETAMKLSKDNVTAKLGNNELQVLSFDRQYESGMGISYYYLLDTSTSVGAKQFAAVKEAIKEQIKRTGKRDKIVAVTFASAIDVVLDGTKTAEQAVEIIDSQMQTRGGTRLFDALTKITELIESNEDQQERRPVVFIATDGADKIVGGTTENEAVEKLVSSAVTIYALGYNSGTKEQLGNLGEIARATNGKIAIIDKNTVGQSLNTFSEEIRNTFVLQATADSNIIEKTVLPLTIQITADGTKYSASKDVTVRDWEKDTEKPEVTKVEVTGDTELIAYFSEKVDGADKKEAYEIFGENASPTVISAQYDSGNNSVKLTLDQKLYSGDYSLVVSGITDHSNEKNTLKVSEVPFSSEIPKDFSFYFHKFGFLVLGLFAAVLIAVLAVAAVKARKKKEAEREKNGLVLQRNSSEIVGTAFGEKKEYLPAIDSAEVEITVIDSHKIERYVHATISGAYIIGRDFKTCDLAVEDKRLSRQHFALAYEEKTLRINDLGSTNGTVINGIPLLQERVLVDSDVIEAGNTKFRIRIVE